MLGLFYDLFVIDRLLGEVIARALADGAITPGDYALYSLLREMGAATPSEISERSGTPPTTISDWIRRHEALGHLERLENPADRRSFRIALTDSGTAVWSEANRRVGPVFDEVLASLGSRSEGAQDLLASIERALRRQLER